MKCAKPWLLSLLIIYLTASVYAKEDIATFYYRGDDTHTQLIHTRIEGSHIKVFLPTMPYLYLSKLINGTLVRSSGNINGWEYMLATSYKKIDELTYDFTLRQGVLFQDGTPFNADSVIENFIFFQKDPFVYSDIHKRLKKVTKISDFQVRFHLHKPYGMLLNDLTTINIYSHAYLQKRGWSTGEGPTSNSTQEPGAYGLGPYI